MTQPSLDLDDKTHKLRESPLFGFRQHEQYFQLHNETHARTALSVKAPCICTHFVFHSSEDDVEADRLQLAALEDILNLEVIEKSPNNAIFSITNGTLRWSRHTEFCTYTFFENIKREASAGGIEQDLPTDWRTNTTGKLILALKIHIDTSDDPIWWQGWEKKTTVEGSNCVSTVSGGVAKVRYDFLTDVDGFLHLYMIDTSDNPKRRGRMVQRLLDMETYRLLSLLALPEVKRIGPKIAAFDSEIASIAKDLNDHTQNNDEDLLTRLTSIAAEVEDLSIKAQFRLNASTAYAGIVEARLNDMREERIEGHQRVSNFILRRLRPAVRTFQSVLDRQTQVAARISRLSNLLRARVDVALEKQNQTLLTSMDQRVQQQLKLQKTVEGFSVIAISYYLIGIFMYFYKPLNKMMGLAHGDYLALFFIPLIIFLVWYVITKVRNKYH